MKPSYTSMAYFALQALRIQYKNCGSEKKNYKIYTGCFAIL